MGLLEARHRAQANRRDPSVLKVRFGVAAGLRADGRLLVDFGGVAPIPVVMPAGRPVPEVGSRVTTGWANATGLLL